MCSQRIGVVMRFVLLCLHREYEEKREIVAFMSSRICAIKREIDRVFLILIGKSPVSKEFLFTNGVGSKKENCMCERDPKLLAIVKRKIGYAFLFAVVVATVCECLRCA